MNNNVIIVAGGKGLRMGGDIPKQFLEIGGKPVLMRTMECFRRFDPAMRMILVLPESQMEYWKTLCRQYSFGLPYVLTGGGDTRFQSVKNGLQLVADGGLTGVHDGVRPFVSVATIRRCYEAAERYGAAVPVMPSVESLRQIDDAGNSRAVERSAFRLVQTPQVFGTEELKTAYERPFQPFYTDDASVVEAAGHRIMLVEGNRENIKLTTPFDLKVAEALLENEGE